MFISGKKEIGLLMTTDFKTDALEKSLQTLREAWTAYQNNKNEELTSIIADSCIQRYEYTLETAWKLMKKYLKLVYGKSDEELTVNNIFRLMSGYNMIFSQNARS